jgi:hypothetical protein
VYCRAPRAERSSARGWLGRLPSEPPGPLGPWAQPLGSEFCLKCVLGSFVFCFFERKWIFPGCLGDPYDCPQQLGGPLDLCFDMGQTRVFFYNRGLLGGP